MRARWQEHRTSSWWVRGIAGLAAAAGLVERGVTVDVVERESYLGGRVGGWTENRHGPTFR